MRISIHYLKPSEALVLAKLPNVIDLRIMRVRDGAPLFISFDCEIGNEIVSCFVYDVGDKETELLYANMGGKELI